MRVSVFGAGYVGLVQAAVLADVGNEVVCIDIDRDRIDQLSRGSIPIYEPGLEPLVRAGIESGKLRFSTVPRDGVEDIDIVFVAVGTPPGEGGAPDMGQVMSVADALGAHIDKRTVVVIKSTVPVGTSVAVRGRIATALIARGHDEHIVDVVSNPEFLKEGSALADCTRPDRIVIGASAPESIDLLRRLYAPFNRNHEKIVVMDQASAELTKYAANCLLATKVSFMNEIAALADSLGADVERVRLGIGSDPRIGYDFLYAGVGFGGSCFPKDVRAAISMADSAGTDAGLLKAVVARNETQKRVLFEKILAHYGGNLDGRTIAVWGLAFKPNTSDVREAPALTIVAALLEAGAAVRAFDPVANEAFRRAFGERDGLTFCASKEDALCGADCLAVVTEWKAFRVPDLAGLKSALREPVVFDGRNLYDPSVFAQQGVALIGIGRPSPAVATGERTSGAGH